MAETKPPSREELVKLAAQLKDQAASSPANAQLSQAADQLIQLHKLDPKDVDAERVRKSAS